MGPKPRARRSSGRELEISEDDSIPDVFFDYIEHLPEAEAANSDEEPPAKRVKAASVATFVAVARHQISFSRPYGSSASAPRARLTRKNVEPYLNLSVASGYLVFQGRQRFRKQLLKLGFSMDQDEISEPLRLILDGVSGEPATQGGFWTSVDVHLDYDIGRVRVRFALELRWNESTYVSNDFHGQYFRHRRDDILRVFFPSIYDLTSVPDRSCHHHGRRRTRIQQQRSPHDFYEAAFVPGREDTEVMAMSIPGLTADLYPFQRRAIQWLLGREGVRWAQAAADGAPDLTPARGECFTALSTHFIKLKDADDQDCYISDLFGVATKNLDLYEAYEAETIRGGILAEEMGLGKTLEIIGLILLHTRPSLPPTVLDPYLGTEIRPTRATLIITPPSLKHQWLSELERHAPQLRVMEYEGYGRSCSSPSEEADLVARLAEQDVVVTTYSELKSELHFALEPPDRSTRGERKHHRPKSPLVQLSWWRVCLDEAQEIESGISNTATLARLIPRVNAWGVTGTPVKDGVNDLRGLLLFLRYEPYASITKVWNDLVRSYPDVFHDLFHRITLRHTKRLIRDELELPPQKRYVITMPFTAVEEQHYQSLFKQLMEDCGLDTEGVPIRADWDPDDSSVLEAMRTALDRLRQTALHPEVGVRNRRALGQKSGPMRTVAEVLDAMIEQSENSILVDQRSLLSNKLTRGQLLENSPRVREALAIWEGVLRESDALVDQCREQLRLEIEQAKTAEAVSNRPNQDDSDDEEDKTLPPRVGEAQRKLRYALEVQHRAVFFCANAHFQIKSNEEMTQPDSDEFKRLEQLETSGYDRAKLIRREILQESHRKATKLMKQISARASNQDFAVIAEFKTLTRKGIESRRIVDTLEELARALNKQADQIDEWREQIVQLLLKELVDEDDTVELTGDEYADSTKVQEDLIAYITVLRTTIADRQAALSGQDLSMLTQDEVKHAVSLAASGEGPSPGKMLHLYRVRDEICPPPQLGSVRSAVAELRDLMTKLRHQAVSNTRARAELEIATEQIKQAQEQLTQQTKLATAMEQEIDKFTGGMNVRVEYYRQLQTVSDQVAAYEGPTDDAVMAALTREEEVLAQRLATLESKHRYLLHLKQADSAEEQRTCVICQMPFTIGVLTVCGHQFCKECITLWFKAHHNCPICKRRLTAANLHDITLKPQELKVHTETGSIADPHQQSPRSKKTGIYTDFSTEKLAQIKNIDLVGPSFTTKVDTLVRHLKWLRESDPGAKSIVFSQYPDFLRVLRTAFTRHQIGFTAFADARGIEEFKANPGIECFLLHARAHSSGLNLVNANHVILCEPLLNTALELQAIARVDRIGQQHETTVWLYIVDGTVEESIYNLSVQRRMEHMGRNMKGKSKESTPELLDSSLEVANALEMQEAQLSKLMRKGKLSGEEVAKADLWSCLFGNKVKSAAIDEQSERLRNDPALRRYLAAEAAEARAMGEESLSL